jgi:hypothetical protein
VRREFEFIFLGAVHENLGRRSLIFFGFGSGFSDWLHGSYKSIDHRRAFINFFFGYC